MPASRDRSAGGLGADVPDTAPEVPVIAVEHLCKRFGGVVAVDEVSFALPAGELFALLGPSGCGKTTVLRLIGGFEVPSAGSIRLDGTDVSRLPPYKRPVNTVFQQYALFPHLSVFDNVAYGPRAKGLARAVVRRRVGDMLEITRLGGLADRRPAELSGGQRQRVALARALVNLPRVLLLDEPLSALDRGLRQRMQAELKRIQREVGVAFVLVTHDQDEALALSDRLAVMRAGRIEQIGTPERVYDAPDSVFVAEFLGAANQIPVTIEAVDRGNAVVQAGAAGAITIAAALGVTPGSPAVMMVRPERIRVMAAAPKAPLVGWPVTVVDLSFRGAMMRVTVRDAVGAELVVEIPAAERSDGIYPGAVGWAAWHPRAARVLPARV